MKTLVVLALFLLGPVAASAQVVIFGHPHHHHHYHHRHYHHHHGPHRH